LFLENGFVWDEFVRLGQVNEGADARTEKSLDAVTRGLRVRGCQDIRLQGDNFLQPSRIREGEVSSCKINLQA
jgi:hypothetical protein